MARARDWAVRCSLELADHKRASFVTLTYDDLHLPPTLDKAHVSRFLRRLRKTLGSRSVRFFASGEYGETTERPHYHAILYGTADEDAIQHCWRAGFARVDPVTPASISYVAGYSAKKIGWKLQRGERVDPSTGEVYEYQPPFVLMSRNPGIGSSSRAYWQSWRTTAIHHGKPVPVPRYLHQAWKDNASPQQLEDHEMQIAMSNRLQLDDAISSGEDVSTWFANRLLATRANDEARHKRSQEKRTL